MAYRSSEMSGLGGVEEFELPPIRARDLLLGSGPRFARDAFGPPLAFYIGWRLGGLGLGIAASTATSLVAFRAERRNERPGFMVRLSLGVVLLQAIVGLVADSERVYLAQPVLVTGCYGFAFLISVAIHRPLAAAFAGELYPFPDEVRQSVTFRRIFGRLSLAWGVYLLMRSVMRLLTLQASTVEAYLLVNFVTGVPVTAALISWSVWYAVRSFRRSDEWGPAIAALEAAQAQAGT